jgi:hypothetical protein
MRNTLIFICLPLVFSCSDDTSSPKADVGTQDVSTIADASGSFDAALDSAADAASDVSTQPDVDQDADETDTSSIEDMSTVVDGVKCASWNVETIFPIAGHDTTRAGDSSSLAFDAAGKAHVAFSTNLGLYYGTNSSGAWDFELIPSPRPVSATTIAVGAQGRVDIVYYEGENYDVRQVTNATGAWVTTVVAEEGIIGEDLTLAQDSQGRLHIAYLDGTRSALVYGVRNGEVWTLVDAVSDTPGRPVPSLLLDGASPLISFGNYRAGLKLATRTNGVWADSIVDPGFDVGGWSSIAKDSVGALHISYSKFMVDNSQLKYATNASGAWVAEVLDDQNNTGFGTTLMERGGVIHIAYISASPSGQLRYASHDASGWTTADISPASGYSVTAMRFDQDGHPAIAFKGGSNALGFATCEP